MAADAKGYLIGQSFHEKLKRTIAAVDGMPVGSNTYRIPTDLSGDVPVASKVFRICTFTGSWAINSSKSVTLKNVATTPNTVSVSNPFFDLTDQGTRDCGIAKDGTAWYLIAASRRTVEVSVITNVTLGTAGLVFTRTNVRVESTATASSVTIGTTACA